MLTGSASIHLGLIAWVAVVAGGSSRADDDGAMLTPGRHHLKLSAAGYTWNYHVHVPKGYDPKTPTPVVLILHGAGGSGDAYLDRAEWAQKADEKGFLAVAPDGLPSAPRLPAEFWTNPRLWNTGELGKRSMRGKVDDLAFFRALLDDLPKHWAVDLDRIYLTGHSNGGGMTFYLGSVLSERFAALAPVAAHYWFGPESPPPVALPTLYIVGTEDPFVPIEGGDITLPWTKRYSPPVEQVLGRWARAIGCHGEPRTESDDGSVKRVDYGKGRDESSLEAVYVARHGHSWPGGSDVLPPYMIGLVSDKLDATDLIWDFFQDRRRPHR